MFGSHRVVNSIILDHIYSKHDYPLAQGPAVPSIDKVQFARARFIEGGQVEPVGTGQGSHVLGGLAQADALIAIPVGVDSIASGDQVRVIDVRGGLA